MLIYLKNKHSLQYDDFKFKCCIGKRGLTKFKKEGDLKTPEGVFAIENLYFRSDRIKRPVTKLKCVKIEKKMGWSNDINNKNYNKLIKINKNCSHEKLFRKDHKYDLLFLLNIILKKLYLEKVVVFFYT